MEPYITLRAGDCRTLLAKMPENSIDGILTDPPYEFTTIRKRFGSKTAAPAIETGTDGSFGRISKGFLGRTWDGTGVAFDADMWSWLLRVLKPGGVCLSFMGARTYHRATCAAEDAGFLIHPFTAWVYGQGMSLAPEMAKMIDKHLGAQGNVVPDGRPVKRLLTGADQHERGTWIKDNGREYQPGEYVPGSAEAVEWLGWRSGAHTRRTAVEPIIFAVKPMSEKSAAANVLRWGTGAFNIENCRTPDGRHPANLLHDGSPEVVDLLPDGAANFFNSFPADEMPTIFYHKKATAEDRAGSNHPTVKPIGLLRHLIRHICPPGGTVLDPFAGSGTTAEAARREGMNCILMEAEPEYIEFLKRRFVLQDDDMSDLLGPSQGYADDLADLL